MTTPELGAPVRSIAEDGSDGVGGAEALAVAFEGLLVGLLNAGDIGLGERAKLIAEEAEKHLTLTLLTAFGATLLTASGATLLTAIGAVRAHR